MNGTEDPRSMHPGPQGPERRPDSAALKTIGILNILFAVLCGCIDTSLWVSASQLMDPASLPTREKFVSDYMREVRNEHAKALASAGTDEEKRTAEEHFGPFEDEEVASVGYDAVVAVSHSESLAKSARFGLFAVLLQVGLLTSGILLLARVSFGRMLAILVCLGLIVLNILLPAALTDTTDHLADRFMTGLAEVKPDVAQDLSPTSKDQVVKIVHAVKAGAPVAYYSVGAFFALYPVIALLILLFSTSLKRGLGIGLEPRVDW